jgi:hypothetical protein
LYLNFYKFWNNFQIIQNKFRKWKRLTGLWAETWPTAERRPSRVGWQPARLTRPKGVDDLLVGPARAHRAHGLRPARARRGLCAAAIATSRPVGWDKAMTRASRWCEGLAEQLLVDWEWTERRGDGEGNSSSARGGVPGGGGGQGRVLQ